MQTVHTKKVAYKGTAKKQVRYLGGWPAIGGSNQQEVDMRIAASNVCWFTIGKMWSSNTVWWRSRLFDLEMSLQEHQHEWPGSTGIDTVPGDPT